MKPSWLLATAVTSIVASAPFRAAADCSGGLYALPQAFAGAWTEHAVAESGVETLVGEVVYAIEAGGCAFSERFTSTHGDAAVALAYVDAERDVWAQTEVSDDGVVRRRLWRSDGDGVVIETDAPLAAIGVPFSEMVTRTRLTPAAGGAVNAISAISDDGGETWVETGRSILRRIR